MIVLGIDPGSTVGWAVGPAGESPPLFGTWDIRPQRGESPGVRYLRLQARLEEVLTAHPGLELVIYEQAHSRGGAATEYAHGCATRIQAWCAERGIEHAAVHSGRLKKWATGKGNASKEEMILEAVSFAKGPGYPSLAGLALARQAGISYGISSDEADAILLWRYGCVELALAAPPAPTVSNPEEGA